MCTLSDKAGCFCLQILERYFLKTVHQACQNKAPHGAAPEHVQEDLPTWHAEHGSYYSTENGCKKKRREEGNAYNAKVAPDAHHPAAPATEYRSVVVSAITGVPSGCFPPDKRKHQHARHHTGYGQEHGFEVSHPQRHTCQRPTYELDHTDQVYRHVFKKLLHYLF